MSDLTDKIRAKYPDDYKDMSDDDLEKSVLAKHPEYKDLSNSVKSTTDNASQTDNVVKSSNDSALKVPETSLKAPPSEANARGDTESISAPKSLSKGNLEANGEKAQDNIIAPEEHESLLSKGWKLLKKTSTTPILPERNFGDDSTYYPFDAKTPILGNLGLPSLGHLYDTIQEQSSPLGIAAAALPLVEGMLGRGNSLADKINPNNEPLPENTPIFRGSEPSVASEQFPNIEKEDALDHRPDLVPVDSNAEKTFNDTRTNIPVNEEDRLLQLVKDKQNMGKELPESDLTNKSINNESKPTATYLGEQPTGNGNETTPLYNVKGGPLDRSTVGADTLRKNGIDIPDSNVDSNNPLTSPTDFKAPQFNRRNMTGETGNLQSKPRLLLNSDGSFINKETGEMYDMRGHKIDELDTSRPSSLIDATDKMNNQEITHNGGNNEPPSYDPLDPHADNPNERKTTLSDIINFPKALKASWDLSAPGRQGLGLIHTKPWWTAWNDMFQGVKSDEAFQATQKAIENRPLFKSYGDQPSFAQKAGLKLTNLGKLSDREESFMSSLAEKFPGVKTSERAYTAYLNKLRADTFENLMSKYKVLGEDGEYNIPLAKNLANYVNNATGRGNLGSLESSAVALNNAFFSPRFMASRLKILGESTKAPFTPSTYMFSQPSVRKEYLKSLLAMAGIGTTIGELAKMSGNATVEHDPTNSDFMKIKVGNTRIDPYAGMQQPIVLASRLLSGKSTSSVSGKTTDLSNPKYGQSNRMDVIGSFTRSKESPALSFAHGLLSGKDNAGNKFNAPEETAQLFIPMVLQDLKQVATENPNLIPYYHENGLGFENTDPMRGMLALPGFVGGSVQNYPSKGQ